MSTPCSLRWNYPDQVRGVPGRTRFSGILPPRRRSEYTTVGHRTTVTPPMLPGYRRVATMTLDARPPHVRARWRHRAPAGSRAAERRPRLHHGDGRRAGRRVRVLRPDHLLWSATPRRADRCGPCGRRARRARSRGARRRPPSLRRVGPDRGRRAASRPPSCRHDGHPGDVRASPQHRLPVAGAGVGRDALRRGHLHRRERPRQLRLSRLPPRVRPRLRGDGEPGHEGEKGFAEAGVDDPLRCR